MAKKEKQAKVKKIRAIPERKINFYKRLQNNPERVSARHKRTMLLMIAQFVLVALVVVELVLLYKERTLEKSVASLENYVTDETNLESVAYAEQLAAEALAAVTKAGDASNAVENYKTYPLVTSEVLDTLEDSCPDKVKITVTGYDSSSGKLSYDAVAPVVTDVSDFIELLKKLDIFRDVYYTGYSESGAGTGYTVKVVCLLNEKAGK